MGKRRASNLVQPGNAGQWDVTHVRNETEDMTHAIAEMIGTQSHKIRKQATFLDEIQLLAQDNENFCRLQNADDWSYKEVCYWLTSIHLQKYIHSFQTQIIDGSILLRDLDEQMLTHELGIKRLHVKKLLREIKKLRGMSPKFKKPSEQSRDALIESLRMEMDSLRRENQHLKQEMVRYKKVTINNNNNTNSGNNSSNNNSSSNLIFDNNQTNNAKLKRNMYGK
jgi:hypothetical protein